jgi:ubiquinol-cytochrome c reductase iron-sulfur subunit
MRRLGAAAIAGLHSLGKGANRTPPDRAVRRLSGRTAGLPAAAGGMFGGLQRGRTDRHDGKGLHTVTTMSSAEHTQSSAEHTRRDFLYIMTGAVAAAGAVAALVPLIAEMNPDASTIAAGAPIEVDLGPIAEGQVIKVFWRGKPIFIDHRTKKEVDEARAVDWHTLPDPQSDESRVKQGKDQWLVLIGICTHLGCIPLAHQGDYDGWFCPCHGSQYDSSGRIRRGPAPANLALPPYEFVSDTKIRIG